MATSAKRADTLPLPRVVYHFKCESDFDPPRPYKSSQHFVALFIQASGFFKTGPSELPKAGPYAIFRPAGAIDRDGLTGSKELWSTAFDWPSVKFRAIGSRHVVFPFQGRALRLARWKSIDKANLAQCVETFRKLKEALDRQDPAGRIRASALLLELLSLYAALPEDSAQRHRALTRFCEMLSDRCCDDISIEQIANDAGMTPQYLRSMFHREIGMRPIDYRTSLRLTKSRELLAGTNLSVKEVAQRTGYPDPFYFSRAFKRQFGISPSEIIRNH